MRKEVAEKFLKENVKVPHIVLGSLGRGNKDEVKDVDLMVNEKYKDFWKDLPYEMNVKMDGDKHALVEVKFEDEVIPLDIFYYTDEEEGCFRAYLAGDKYFNIALRSIAKRKGYTLNQKYLKENKTGKIFKFVDEKELFDKLGLDFIPYAEREVGNIGNAFKVIKKYRKEEENEETK